MDSVRVTWDADHDTYVIHVPGQPDVVATIQELEDLQTAIAEQMKELSA